MCLKHFQRDLSSPAAVAAAADDDDDGCGMKDDQLTSVDDDTSLRPRATSSL